MVKIKGNLIESTLAKVNGIIMKSTMAKIAKHAEFLDALHDLITNNPDQSGGPAGAPTGASTGDHIPNGFIYVNSLTRR